MIFMVFELRDIFTLSVVRSSRVSPRWSGARTR